MEMVIEFVKPDDELSPNSRPNKYRKARVVEKARLYAQARARKALYVMGVQSFKPKAYKIIWYYFGVPRDEDNCVTSCKAYLDGCADAFEANDRYWHLLGVERIRDKEKRNNIKIIFKK